MKKVNNLLVSHLSPDVLHLWTEFNTTDTQVESAELRVKWLWQELTADHSRDNLYLPFPVFYI